MFFCGQNGIFMPQGTCRRGWPWMSTVLVNVWPEIMLTSTAHSVIRRSSLPTQMCSPQCHESKNVHMHTQVHTGTWEYQKGSRKWNKELILTPNKNPKSMHSFPVVLIMNFSKTLCMHTHTHYWQAALSLSPTCHAIWHWNASLAWQIKGRKLPV